MTMAFRVYDREILKSGMKTYSLVIFACRNCGVNFEPKDRENLCPACQDDLGITAVK
jgi:rubrerythrin